MRVLEQFEHPHGTGGRMVGWILTWANASTNRTLIDRLSLSGNEMVLEIGYGPGVALSRAFSLLPHGVVSGIDPSEVMFTQARARNAPAIASGRMDIRQGDPSSLPWSDGTFEVVYSANNVQLWSPFETTLGEIRRVLKPGGRLAIAVQGVAARVQTGPLGTGIEDLEASLRGALAEPDWASPDVLRKRLWIGPSLFVTARRT